MDEQRPVVKERQSNLSIESALHELEGAKDPEALWLATIYQGDHVPQLTVRAVVMGFFLGAFMSLSNLYVGLKIGWGLGVAITASILSFVIYRGLHRLLPGVFKTDMTILENNCMQSAATSAGSSTVTPMVSAIAAYLIITGHQISTHILFMWSFCLASLGVFMAVPMKRQMINIEQLRFPSGVACAETLKGLHGTGADATSKAKSLAIGGCIGLVISWLREVRQPFGIPAYLNFPGALDNVPLKNWTISFETSSIMIAAGAIMGWRVAWSMLLGAAINYFWLAPWAANSGAISLQDVSFRTIVSWSTWAGGAVLVASGLMSLILNWRALFKSISHMSSALGKQSLTPVESALSRIEVPASWFIVGIAVSGLGCVAILARYFSTPIWMGVLAVFMTFVLAVVACRATGESDITPVGAMGKITQLFFGVLAPTNVVTNLMTASVTAGAAGSSADLLTDLKSGYLLGANPRQQFIAQFLGIFAGVLVVVPAFQILVPNAHMLGGTQWPAPSAQIWAAVARLLANGLESLHPTARVALVAGLFIGALLPVLEVRFPRLKSWIPSATGIGIAMVIPFFNSLSMFLGAAIALGLERRRPKLAEKYTISVSSGLIAGESLLGVFIALASALGWKI